MVKKIWYTQFYILLFLANILLFSCEDDQDKILPKKRTLIESVYTSITIQPDSLYQVYSAVSGIIDKILVEEGDLVKKEEQLISIINNTPKLNTKNAQLSLNLAQKNYSGNAAILMSIQDEINAAKLKYKNDSINYFRQKNLWNQNIGSKIEYDTKELNYQLSKNNLQLLQSKYNRTKNELQTTLKQAQNNYQSSLINTKDFIIKSKINGKVYAINKNQGEIVNSMEPLASLGSETLFIIEMLVDEVDIVKVTKNQKVILTLDAYNDSVFTGKVSKILPKKDKRNQTFIVEALFDKQPKVLYPGLSGEANIVIAKKDSVLTIPKNYLINGNQVKTQNGLITVKPGLQNLEFIEILSGINENTYIYKPEE